MWLKRTSKQKIEEIITATASGMSEEELGKYYYELNQLIFNLVGKVDIELIEITADQWKEVAQAQYPTLTEIELPNGILYTTTLDGLQRILKRDWTNRLKFIPEKQDCDDFAHMLSERLNYYYGLTSVVEVWGDTSEGYHAFDVVVLRDRDLLARIIEPQSDKVFISEGYIPKETK